jgi:hypothetical protein
MFVGPFCAFGMVRALSSGYIPDLYTAKVALILMVWMLAGAVAAGTMLSLRWTLVYAIAAAGVYEFYYRVMLHAGVAGFYEADSQAAAVLMFGLRMVVLEIATVIGSVVAVVVGRKRST